jgi:hypothetical protein
MAWWTVRVLLSFFFVSFFCLRGFPLCLIICLADLFSGRINKIALRYYMEFFDFSTLRLDMAFRFVDSDVTFVFGLCVDLGFAFLLLLYRRLCEKLFLKAETQQVDRILDEFSKRYWDCNPGGLYGSASTSSRLQYSLQNMKLIARTYI